MHLFPKTHFDFIHRRGIFFAISGILLGGSIVSLATRGIRFGIDFTGGTLVQVTFEKPMTLGTLRDAAGKSGLGEAALQSFEGTQTFAIRMKPDVAATAEGLEKTLADLQVAIGDNKFRVDKKEYVGPAVGKHLFVQALWAIAFSLMGIIVYLGFRFANPIWGVAGIVALVHDVLATYGLFSIAGAEVDLLIISALLTIGGYSIHDTIVIFDRMREKMKLMRHEKLDVVINESINETLSRTIITSGTVLLVTAILFFFGGKVIHHFAMAMVFGAIVGTYSSIAVAVPLVYQWVNRGKKS